MTYDIEVVVAGAFLLLMILRRKRRSRKITHGGIALIAAIAETIVFVTGLTMLLLGLYADRLARFLPSYLPLP